MEESKKTMEASKKTMEESKKKALNWFIDLVNPKFKNYNRPFLLALVIGGLTFASTMAMYSIMVNDCFDYNTGSGVNQHTVETVLNSDTVHCHFSSQIMQWKVVAGNIQEIKNNDCKWNFKGAEKICPADSNNWWLELPDCEYLGHDDGWHTGLTTFTFRTCPDPLSTLGAAFGYSAFIELFFTGIIIIPLLKGGFLLGKFLSVLRGGLSVVFLFLFLFLFLVESNNLLAFISCSHQCFLNLIEPLITFLYQPAVHSLSRFLTNKSPFRHSRSFRRRRFRERPDHQRLGQGHVRRKGYCEGYVWRRWIVSEIPFS
jgi:hypothetical protein